MTKLAILSDTHDRLLPEVIDQLWGCDYILHAGDFTRPEILDQLRSRAQVYVVRGNCDGPWASHLRQSLTFSVEGVTFSMAHRREHLPVGEEAGQVMVYGHTHVLSEEKTDGRLYLNPGSAGINRWGLPSTMVLMTVTGKEYTWHSVTLREGE